MEGGGAKLRRFNWHGVRRSIPCRSIRSDVTWLVRNFVFFTRGVDVPPVDITFCWKPIERVPRFRCTVFIVQYRRVTDRLIIYNAYHTCVCVNVCTTLKTEFYLYFVEKFSGEKSNGRYGWRGNGRTQCIRLWTSRTLENAESKNQDEAEIKWSGIQNPGDMHQTEMERER